MAIIRPFRGVRPLPYYAKQVAARPYDVLSTEEARVEADGNPLSFLHVGKPEIDLPPEVDPHDDRVYAKGRENLNKLIAEGILQQDAESCYYLYALSMGQHVQYGIVGCLSVSEYLDNTIKKHELTRPDKEDDRTRHVLATHAHTGPIFLTYHATQRIDSIVGNIRKETPAFDFVAMDGVRHQLWVISDLAAVNEISSSFEDVLHLYVADGHHRTAAATRAAMELARGNQMHTGNEEYNFFLGVLFPDSQLKILEYNRVVKDLNGLSSENFLEAARKKFAAKESPRPVKPTQKGIFGMYLAGRWYLVDATNVLSEIQDPVKRLDVSLLQHHILSPILGIEDVRTNPRIDFVGGIRGLQELERRVDSGEMAVAFSLYPTSIDELMTIADSGKMMPPKSTWFEPKLRDGIIVHLLS